MKKFFLVFLSALAFFQMAVAVELQEIELKNGTVMKGYVQKIAGDGGLVFHSEYALISVSSKNCKISNSKTYKYNTLDKKWKDWGDKNNAFLGVGDNRTLTLSDVIINGAYSPVDSVKVVTGTAKVKKMSFEESLIRDRTVFSKVKILEEGVNVKFLSVDPSNFDLSWDDVEIIKAVRRSKEILSGINCKYQVKSGAEYEGEYAGETYNTVSLYLKSGVMKTMNYQDVVKYTYFPLNPNQTIFEQSELLDVVFKKNGSEERGIIIEKNYTKSNSSDNYLVVQDMNNDLKTIYIPQIRETQKVENPGYKPQKDIILNNGDVKVNREDVTFVKVTEKNNSLFLDRYNKGVKAILGKTGSAIISVEYRNDAVPTADVYQLVRLTKTKKSVYFTYKDLVEAGTRFRPSDVKISTNNTAKVEYNISVPGEYALYNAQKKQAIPIIVTR